MKREETIRAMAGSIVLVTLALGHLWSPWWHLVTALVGASLFQSAFTKVCPMEMLLAALGVKEAGPQSGAGGEGGS
ncbi:MAG: DUF2892 domain-containing protein [Proteobacteria bacterium]|nr:DUF2892 domain-containing protein [Pseudomonadota bacterium]